MLLDMKKMIWRNHYRGGMLHLLMASGIVRKGLSM